MVVGERVRERLSVIGITQAELARRVGVSQPTINNIIRRSKKGSTHIHKVARELLTTPAYLTGETDDPDKDAPAPLPAPTVQHIMMSVALPSEAALERMFEGMIDSMPGVPRQRLARELAALLPSALGNIQGPLIERPSVPADAPPVQLEDDGDARPARRRA